MECVPGSSSITDAEGNTGTNPGDVVSPRVSIRLLDIDGNQIELSDLPPGQEVVFTLPLQGNHKLALAGADKLALSEQSADPCAPRRSATCAWWNEDTEDWSFDGCRSVADAGTNAVRCVCTHTTEFALVLRDDGVGSQCSDQYPLAYAIALAVAYFLGCVCASIQLVRLLKVVAAQSAKTSSVKIMLQHVALVVLCVGRVVVLLLRATRQSAALLVLLGCIPYVVEFCIFADLARSFMKVTLVMKPRLLSVLLPVTLIAALPAVLAAVCLSIVVFVVAPPLQATLAIISSYVLSGIVVVLCLSVMVGGFVVVCQLRNGKSMTTTASLQSASSSSRLTSQSSMAQLTRSQRKPLSPETKLVLFTMFVSLSLGLQSVCWVLSVQRAFSDGDAALIVDCIFYSLGIFNVIAVLLLRAKAVGTLAPFRGTRDVTMMQKETQELEMVHARELKKQSTEIKQLKQRLGETDGQV